MEVSLCAGLIIWLIPTTDTDLKINEMLHRLKQDLQFTHYKNMPCSR